MEPLMLEIRDNGLSRSMPIQLGDGVEIKEKGGLNIVENMYLNHSLMFHVP